MAWKAPVVRKREETAVNVRRCRCNVRGVGEASRKRRTRWAEQRRTSQHAACRTSSRPVPCRLQQDQSPPKALFPGWNRHTPSASACVLRQYPSLQAVWEGEQARRDGTVWRTEPFHMPACCNRWSAMPCPAAVTDGRANGERDSERRSERTTMVQDSPRTESLHTLYGLCPATRLHVFAVRRGVKEISREDWPGL